MRAWRRLIRRRVVANLVTGTVFDGILWSTRGGLLVLREARIHEPRGEVPWRRVDGEVVVELSRVEFIQVVPGPDAWSLRPLPERV